MRKSVHYLSACLTLLAVSSSSDAVELGAERAIRVETILDAPTAAVWTAWTTAAGAETFFAPKANIALQIGGPYEVFFNPADDRMSTKGMTVLSYSPSEMVSFEWIFPQNEFPQLKGERTWVVVHMWPDGPTRTHVSVTHLGWKQGPEWDRAYTHMRRGWDELAVRLKGRFSTGPIQWNSQQMMWKERARGTEAPTITP